MFDILIVDDEPLATEVIELLIQQYFPADINSIHCFSKPSEALNHLQNHPVDLIFLDIRMNEMDGLEMMKHYDTSSIPTILVTAYNKHVIDALRNQALDYLVKPVDDDEFCASFKRFKEYKAKKEKAREKQEINPKIALQKTDDKILYSIDGVVRCEGQGNYSVIYLDNATKIMSAKTLKEYENALTMHGFIRCHKSHLVNLKHIKKLLHSSEILLSNNDVVPIAKRRKKSTLEIIKRTIII